MNNFSRIAPKLRREENGLWVSAAADSVSYPSEGNELCFAMEDTSYWFGHRNNCIAAVVKAFRPQGALFDIGGGNGFVAAMLQKLGFEVVLVEPGWSGAQNAQKRGVQNVICSTLEQIEFLPASLPAIGVFDVIEHIEDDLKFLQQLRLILEPKGYLFLTVPAYQMLWSNDDVYAGHFRRYTTSQICQKVEAAGLNVVFRSYIFGFLPVPIGLFRSLPSRVSHREKAPDSYQTQDHNLPKGVLGSVMKRCFRRELKEIQRLKPLRFGSSCLIVARAPAA